ncbi:MAG: hypothetical protein AAGI91_12170 [Bacteroidota bacterium]
MRLTDGFSVARYRTDLRGFALAWGIVGVLIALAYGVVAWAGG